MTHPMFTAVLVLYRMPLTQSRCYQSLLHSLARAGAGQPTLLVYDNSPQSATLPQEVEAAAENFPGKLLYRHDSSNGGVAAAYNAGLAEARENGSDWLLLLDQDTELTPAYLAELGSCMQTVPATVAAIIPRLVQNGATHSPQHLPDLSHRPVREALSGLLPFEVTAFNSGATLRVAAVQQFPGRYWLDFLDHAVFQTLQAAGGKVWLIQARLSHELSTESLGRDASLDRYRNVLQAERDFYREYGTPRSVVFYHLRRLKQTLGQLLKVPDKRFALLSLRAAAGLLPATPARYSLTHDHNDPQR